MIATMKERISTTTNDDTFQEILTLTCEERSKVRRSQKAKHFTKDTLKDNLPS